LRVDVLIEGAAQGRRHYLYAPTDAEEGYLTVGRQTCHQQLLPVAPVVDATQLLHWLFAQKERVDVASARQEQAVDAVEGTQQGFLLLIRGDNQRCASGGQYRADVSVGHGTIAFAEVARDAYDGLTLVWRKGAVYLSANRIYMVRIVHG